MFTIQKENFNLSLVSSSVYGVIRTITYHSDPSNPWFSAVDLAVSLGYRDPSKSVLKMNITKRTEPLETINYILHPENYNRRMIYNTVVTDTTGMLKMVMGSTMPNAENFKDWLADVVQQISNGTIARNADLLKSQLDEFGVIPREAARRQRVDAMGAVKQNLALSSHIYDGITNAVYRGVFGRDASQMRDIAGLDKGANIRDYLSDGSLCIIIDAEKDLEKLSNQYTTNNITINQSHLNDIEREFRNNYGNNPYNFNNSSYPILIWPFITPPNKECTDEYMSKIIENINQNK